MSWPLVILAIVGSLFALMATGMPLAVAFMIVNLVGIYMVMGEAGLMLLPNSILSSLTSFTLLPIPMFILMGELLFRAGLADDIVRAVDAWLGRLSGRLSMLASIVGGLFGTFSGSSLATTAMLGSTLVPQMRKRGYHKSMSLGPILGSGGLAILIPPSSLAVLLGAIGQISIGRIIVAILIPGLLLAAMYTIFIYVYARMRPLLAPPYDGPESSIAERLALSCKYILPLGFLLFLVVGLIILGVATPEESASVGVFGAVAMIVAYGRAKLSVFVAAVRETVKLTGMIFLLIAGATVFSQLLSFTGATSGLASYVIDLPLPPLAIVAIMLLVVLILGGFMGPVAIMLITLPIFVPAITTLGFNPVWFAVLFLIAIEMSFTTPPYGPNLFVLKAAVPNTSFRDVSFAAIPYLAVDLVLLLAILFFPAIALWLPGLM